MALNLATSAGVVGKGAVPELGRVGLACVALFAVGGFGLTRLLLPPGLRAAEPLWVLPVGACAVALSMTVLGFAGVPFKVSLGVTLAAGALTGVLALLRGPGPPPEGALRRAAWPVWIAVLLAAVALIPLFRAGFATVEGQGQDAHLAVGTAQFLQHHPPTAIAPQEPVDRVPLVWRSKQPIYYALGAAATLSGLEPYQAISTVAAVTLALAALGFFLVARELLGAPRWAALAGMALIGLDRMVLHTVMHPYYNQTWGFLALPFVLVLGWWAVREPTRGGLTLLGLFLAILAFAYPLAAPLVVLPLAIWLWPERGRLHPRRMYGGRRSLLWMVPLGFVLAIPLVGVIEKALTANYAIFTPGLKLNAWGGDLLTWFPEPWFFGLKTWTGLALAAPVLLYGTWLALRAAPRRLAGGLAAVLVFALVFAIYFRIRDFGWYFHFKVLAFVAPLAIVVAIAGLARSGRRRLAYGAVALLIAATLSSANAELGQTFDELPRETLQLRQIDAALPPGRSIRLDVDPDEQPWVAYMLAGQPLCSRTPLLNTSYPHVPISRKADFILTHIDTPVPADAASRRPVKRLDGFLLYRAKASIAGPENCSQRMVQTVNSI